MKTDTPSFEAQQIVRLRRRDQIRRLLERDKTPLAILFMAAVVGTVTGLVGVAFEKAVTGCKICVLARWHRLLTTPSGMAFGVYSFCTAGDGGVFSGA